MPELSLTYALISLYLGVVDVTLINIKVFYLNGHNIRMKCNVLLKVVVTLSPMTNHKRSGVRNGINSLMTSIFIMENNGGIVIISFKRSFWPSFVKSSL